jgi:hypothetical protein
MYMCELFIQRHEQDQREQEKQKENEERTNNKREQRKDVFARVCIGKSIQAKRKIPVWPLAENHK